MQRKAPRSAAALCAAVFFSATAWAQQASVWGEKEIRASRAEHHAPGSLPDRTAYPADPLNLFLVVEAGDDHVTVLDGDRLEPIHRFASRKELQGEPGFTPDGRFAFFASRDGWISKFDLWNLKTVAEVRAGLDTRNLAVSSDGKFVAVANHEPHTLVILDAGLQLLKIVVATDSSKRRSSRVALVRDSAPRRSFVAALPDLAEIWEISYDRAAPEIAEGLVHDYKLREGTFISGFLNPRRTPLEDAIEDFRLAPDGRQLLGIPRGGGKGQVIHLDVRRRIATLDLDWKTAWRTKSPEPRVFLHGHPASRYAFADAVLSREHRDTLRVIDRQNPEIVAELRPAPGKTLAHVEFDRYGRYALASLQEADGAVIVYDASTLNEVKRLSMRKPMGKYNVFNEINRYPGSSH